MASAALPLRSRRQRSGRHLFSSSDDNAMLNQIRATHAPDGRELDVAPILRIVDDILRRSTPVTPGILQEAYAQTNALTDGKDIHDGVADMMDLLANTINRISCEISCKCSSSGDAHTTTLALFNMLSSYSWDAKVVLSLAAFAICYGEFWLVTQLSITNPLAKSIAVLKQLPELMAHSNSLKTKDEAIRNLIRAMMRVTQCMVDIKELPSQYIGPDIPAYEAADALIPTATYWTIRSIVACASQIMGLIGMSQEYIETTTEAWELSSLAHKVGNIHEHLTKQLDLCYQHIGERKHIEAYQSLKTLFETPHLDNLKILKTLIYAKDDQLPLFHGATKKRVSIDVLRRRNVLLFISDLDLSNEELSILDQMYQESRNDPTRPQSDYEIVWLPIVDRSTPWTEEKQKQFEMLQSLMLWYTVCHPTLLDPAVIRYIKEEWHFNKKLILVVLDPQGRLVNPNAVHMMWIWGSIAFPFTTVKEEALWKDETWRIELLADTIEPLIFTWIQEEKYICLYGGEDMEWIQKFTKTAKKVAQDAGIPLEMLYVGKSNPKEKVRKNIAAIVSQKLSHTLPDPTLIWFFWVRLESMWHSKLQHGKSVTDDPIMQEIVKMLSFDGSEQGWAILCRGSDMAKAKGYAVLACFEEFNQWKDDAATGGFIPALIEQLRKRQTPHHCNRLILPGTTGTIPEKVVCAECGRSMEKFIMYRCCTD